MPVGFMRVRHHVANHLAMPHHAAMIPHAARLGINGEAPRRKTIRLIPIPIFFMIPNLLGYE